MLKGVLFDFGGTLLDVSEWHSDAAYQKDLQLLRSLGADITLDKCREVFAQARSAVYEKHKGSPRRHQIGLVFSEVCGILGIKADPVLCAKQDYEVLYELANKAYLREGAQEMLDHMRSRKLRTALVCNGSILRCNMIVDRLDIRNYFDTIIISEEVGYEKCTGAPFRRALARLKLLPDEAVVVGNNMDEDIAGAKKTGMRAILLERGKKAAAASEDGYKPDYRIKSLIELKKILKEL